MNKIDLKNLTITSTRKHLDSKDFSAVDLVSAYLEIIKEKNKDINAYLEIYADVLAQAEIADKIIASGKAKTLTGIPFAIKDNILIKGKIASASSKILANYVATYDATVITKLKDEGAVFIGRTNMDEFAMGSSTETSAYGTTKNPYDIERVPGGSSGGSAAAVAMDGALVALGSDTGGSIRQPASFCGLVGLKPTYGAVSRYGVMSMGSSLDQIGPFGKTVEDTEIIFNIIRGKDKYDSTTYEKGFYNGKEVSKTKNGKLIIGVPRKLLEMKGLDEEVLTNFNESLKRLKKIGYEIRDIELPNASYSLAVYYILMPAEVSSNLARFDGVKYGVLKEGKNLLEDYLLTRGVGFGKETRRRVILGTYVLSTGYYDAYYGKAQLARDLIISDFEKVFKDVHIVLTPTTPSPAFKIGEKTNDPIAMYLADIFTVTANITGLPAISVPSGVKIVDDKKLPLGIQATAQNDREDLLFSFGKDFENIVKEL